MTNHLVDYKPSNGTLKGFPGADGITNEELLELEMAVLFPAALENVITKENVRKLRCKIPCELANGQTTPQRMTSPNQLSSLAAEFESYQTVVHVVHVPTFGEGRFLQVYQNNEAQEGFGFLGHRE